MKSASFTILCTLLGVIFGVFIEDMAMHSAIKRELSSNFITTSEGELWACSKALPFESRSQGISP